LRGADPAFHLFSGGVAQTCRALACQARGRRFESGRPRFRGGRGVDGSTRGRDPRWRRFEPGRPPSTRADAEHRRAQQAVTLSPRAVVVRLHPSASRGCSSTGRAPRLQRGRCRFDSDRLHLRLRSVNGKHAPFVRPRCGFNSCRRLEHADVAQQAEHRVANPDGPVRFGSSASQVRGVTGSTASSNLAGPGSIPGGPAGNRSSRAGAARLSPGTGGPRLAPGRCGSTPLPDRTPRLRRIICCGPERVRLSTPNRTVAGSSPARSFMCSGSSVVEQSGPCQHDRSSITTGRGPE
jgi:hypothetical protein